MTNTQTLIKNIKEIIEQRGLGLLDLEERTGISQYYIEKLLAGRKVITVEMLPLFASALEMSIDKLYAAAAPSMVIGDRKYSEIAVVDRDNNLIASITADNIIEAEGYKVACVNAAD